MNGYKNRETWAVALHLSNDQDLYNRYKGLSASAIQRKVEHDLSGDRYELVHAMARDAGDMDKVDWVEVSEALKS